MAGIVVVPLSLDGRSVFLRFSGVGSGESTAASSSSSSSPSSSSSSSSAAAVAAIAARRPPVNVDTATGKSKEVNLSSLARPHMRSFYLSALGFFAAFTGWFALSALATSITAATPSLTAADFASADVANVASNIVFRVFVGPAVEAFGARRVMATLLVAGSVPLALAGTVTNGSGLLALRFFVGILGAVFVPCQMWTQRLFHDNVVGSANAIAAGWGNMGGGFTYLVVPQIFNGFTRRGVNPDLAWRITVILPALFCVFAAVLCWIFGDDDPRTATNEEPGHTETDFAVPTTPSHSFLVANNSSEHLVPGATSVESPTGAFRPAPAAHTNEKAVPSEEPTAANALDMAVDTIRTLFNPNVLLLMLLYACSFGVELCVDSKLGTYLSGHFKRANCDPQTDASSCSYFSPSSASLLGSTFGLLNFVTRPAGGVLSDYAALRTRSTASETSEESLAAPDASLQLRRRRRRGSGSGDEGEEVEEEDGRAAAEVQELVDPVGARGRLLTQTAVMLLNGAALIGFSRVDAIAPAVVLLVLFSVFTEVACGVVFSIVPFVDPAHKGIVSGWVGAGGSIGGTVFNAIFRVLVNEPSKAFLVMGCVVIVAGVVSSLLLSIAGVQGWRALGGWPRRRAL